MEAAGASPPPQSADKAHDRKNRSEKKEIGSNFCFLVSQAFSTFCGGGRASLAILFLVRGAVLGYNIGKHTREASA